MSASSIDRAANDADLRRRVDAMIYKIMANDSAKADSDYGKRVRTGMAINTGAYYAVAVATETAYETAVLNGRGAPGHDQDVITDANIHDALVASWPADTAPGAMQMGPA